MVRVDRERRIFADPAGIRVQRHAGPYYRYEGAHLSEPSPQRTPVLYQAGASSRGQRFAAAHAECVFLTGAQPAVRDIVAALRKQVQDAGRRREDIQVYAMATVIVGETDAQAWEKHAEYARYANPMAALAHYGSQVHIDFALRPGRADPGTGHAGHPDPAGLDHHAQRADLDCASCWRRCRTATGCRPS